VRGITKGPEPASLIAHRQNRYSDYDNYASKDDLRRALVAEQSGLCCYCMGRIRSESTAMKIEHWQSQLRYQDRQLAYGNLLGACLGGHGLPEHLQHCDTRKGDADLEWNPADPVNHIETRVRYETDGTIRSDELVFDGQLNDVLNLNLAHIRNNRKSVLTAVLDWFKEERRKLMGPLPRTRIETEISRRTNGAGSLAPYCQVAVWWLRQKLARMAR